MGLLIKFLHHFIKILLPIWDSDKIQEYSPLSSYKLFSFEFHSIFSLESFGFLEQKFPVHLSKSADQLFEQFVLKLDDYQKARDFFALEGTSNLATHLRFGLISPKQLFNKIKKYDNSEFFIRELFWREFYNCILYHFPKSEFENFQRKKTFME